MKKKETTISIIPNERIIKRIFWLRGDKVMLDSDLAELYEVSTKRLIEQMKRNVDRFPSDFMFQLSDREMEVLRSQIATSNGKEAKAGRGGRRYNVYAFTEPGVAMLSSVLKSKRAVAVNIQIIRTFIELRKMLVTHESLRKKIEAMEQKYDKRFKAVFDVLRQLLKEEKEPVKKIGFAERKKNSK